MNQEILFETLQQIHKCRVGIIGDFCLDIYWQTFRDSQKISVETLKVINQVTSQKCTLGGAGNLALNVKELKVQSVSLFGIIGDDLFGRELLTLMESKGLNAKGILTQNNNWLSNAYIKPILGLEEQSRFDLGFQNSAQISIQDKVLKALEESLSELDIVIINQQWTAGIHTSYFREKLSQIIKKTSIPFIVDSRDFPGDYHHAIRKMNDFELLSLYKPDLKPQEKINTEELKNAGLELYKKFNRMIIVTRGNKSTFLINHNQVLEVPIKSVTGEIDTVGAGDSFLAGFSSVFGIKPDANIAIEMGNLVASITIKKLQETGTASPEEILKRNKE